MRGIPIVNPDLLHGTATFVRERAVGRSQAGRV